MTNPIDAAARGLISSSTVQGTSVYNVEGERLGSIDCVMIDRQKGTVAYAVMAFGGFLGLGEKRHPVPWESMHYDTSKEGYVVSLSKQQLTEAPNLNPGEFGQLSDRAYEETVYTHYKAEPYWL